MLRLDFILLLTNILWNLMKPWVNLCSLKQNPSVPPSSNIFLAPRILSAFRDVCSAALRVADDKAVNKTVTTSHQKISIVRRIVMMSPHLCWVSRIELETKVIIRRFPKISQSQRRPLLGPSPGRKRILHRHYVNPNRPSLMIFSSTSCGLMPV